MYDFPFRDIHFTVHAAPRHVKRGVAVNWQGQRFETLAIEKITEAHCLPVSFEAAYERLEQLPRLYIEPDGSFVCAANSAAASRWQFDGVLYDRDQFLHYVELKGHCPLDALQPVLEILRGGATALMFQFLQAAVFLDEVELARWWRRGQPAQ